MMMTPAIAHFRSSNSSAVATRRRCGIWSEEGSQLYELAMVMPVFVLLLFGAIDFGRAYYVNMEVAAAAEAGAAYGAQNPTDTSGMKAAALLNAPDISGLTPTASYGTECSDGTKAVASPGVAPTTCSVTIVQYIEVDTTATYKPLFAFPGMPSAFTMSGKARMRTSYL
jgi:Flp pilus assembly protein TadG